MTNPLSHHLLLQHVLTHSPYVTLYWKILHQEPKIWAFFFFFFKMKSDGCSEGNQMKHHFVKCFLSVTSAHAVLLTIYISRNMCFWQNLLHYNKKRGPENSCNLLFYIYNKCKLLIKVLPLGFSTAKI